MNRNTTLAIAAVLLVILGAGGMYTLYKGYKKYRAEQRKEYRFEGKLGTVSEGFDVEGFKKQILADEHLNQVIEAHDLVNLWEVDDAGAAKKRIREKFTVQVDGVTLKVSYRDRDKDTAHVILQSIVKSYATSKRQAPPSGAQ